MSFSASTCLTDLGTTPLGPTLKIYSNPTAPSSPGTFVLDVPTADVTGGNCPYVYELPDGTTSIRLSDPVSGCYCDIPITNVENICITCDLNFISYEPTTVGKIVAGDISGSCDNNITDYLIYWYETSDPTTVKFTSGKGSDFSYLYPHPLSGLTAVPATSGTYSAVLQKIKLDGVIYSKTGGTGTVTSDLECLPSIENGNPIIVDALNCNNGDSDLPQYEHKFDYNAGTGGGVLPEPLSTTFELVAGTKYFPWKFKGNTVPDKIKLTLIGSAYGNNPIIVDYWEVGEIPNISTNTTPTLYPKSADTTNFFQKITVLSAFTISTGDEILIEVIQSTANNQTSWTFYCGCINDVNCFNCVPPTARTITDSVSYQYKISASTITAAPYDACGSYLYSARIVNACPYSAWTGSTDYLYMGGDGVDTTSTTLKTAELWFNRESCSRSGNNNYPACLNYGSSTTITYEKTVGLFKITSNNPTVISQQYNNYLNVRSAWITPNSGDSTNIEYYRYMEIGWPNSTGNTPCGDGTITKKSILHITSLVTTGQTGGDYYISFTQPIIVDNMTFTNCQLYCNSGVEQIVTLVNNSATGTTENYTGTSTWGSIYSTIFHTTWVISLNNAPFTEGQINSYILLNGTENNTYPGSGLTTTLIPSLSGETCSSIRTGMTYLYDYLIYQKYLYRYIFKATNPLNLLDFELYASPIDSKGFIVDFNIPAAKLIYTKVSGVVTIIDPDYFV